MKTLVASLIILCVSQSWALAPLTVAFSLDKPPYVIRSTESGLEVEILRLIFHEMGHDLVPVFQPPARSIRSLELGRVDAMATITNAPQFYLSAPYITFRNFAWTLERRKIHIHEVSDLSKYRTIAFQNARFFLGAEFGKAVEKNPNYQEYADQARQIRMLLSDRTDVVICEERTFQINRRTIASEAGGLPSGIEKHPIFGESRYSVAFRNIKLRDSFNEALSKLESRNSFEKIYKKYAVE